jgi:hypothetical protein
MCVTKTPQCKPPKSHENTRFSRLFGIYTEGSLFEKIIGDSENKPNFVKKLAIKYLVFLQILLIMTIQRTDTEILITLPASINIDGLQRLLDYLLYKEATKDSQAQQHDVDVLAREVNKEWWANNNHRFIAS